MSDTTDLQALINAAIANGQNAVTLPPRTYVLDSGGRLGGGPCLILPASAPGFRLHGAKGGTVLRQADGLPPSTRTLYIQGAGALVTDLVFDGGAQGDVDEHRAGVFVQASGVTLRNVAARFHTGDGFYLFDGADNCAVIACTAHGNQRNGITFGANMVGVDLLRCQFLGNGAQQVDTEPGVGAVVQRLLLKGCTLSGDGQSRDFALTLGGSSKAAPGRDITVADCVIDGAINLVWATDVTITRCCGTNPSAKPCLQIWRDVANVQVSHCAFTTQAGRGISIEGTGEGVTPTNIAIEDSSILVDHDPGAGSTFGIYASCIDTLAVRRCFVTGNGARGQGGAGISVRAVAFDAAARCVEIVDNDVRSFATTGVQLQGNAAVAADGTRRTAHIDQVIVRGNRVGNRNGFTNLAIPFALDDGSAIANRLDVGPGNVVDPGLTAVYPPHARIAD